MRQLLLLMLLAVPLMSGCTRESVRLALEAQQRADDVQRTVFEHQQAGLRVLLYRDLVAQLETAGRPLDDAQRAILNRAWNDRDLIAFWADAARAGAGAPGGGRGCEAGQRPVDCGSVAQAGARQGRAYRAGTGRRGGSGVGYAGGGRRCGVISKPQDWRRWLWPLRSRKVQVALATVVVAHASQVGWHVEAETVATVLAVGVALILGIAHEDAGKASPPTRTTPGPQR
jgi:hypothetical protein